MRYAVDSSHVDGLPPGEGCFLACTFWLADNLMLAGRLDEATALFERLLRLTNDVGLLSEEYDPVGRRLLGNFPQAFSHVSLVNSAHNLSKSPAQAGAPGRCGIVRRVSWPERPVIHEVNTWPWLHDLAERAGRDGHAGHRSARGVGRPVRSRCRRRLADGRVGAQSGRAAGSRWPTPTTWPRSEPPSRTWTRTPTSPVRPTACAGSWPTSASAGPRASPWPAPSSATAACACCSTSCPTTSPRTTRGPRSTPSTSCPAPTAPATPPAATRTSRRGPTRCSSTPSRSRCGRRPPTPCSTSPSSATACAATWPCSLLNRIFAQTWGEPRGLAAARREYWTDVIGAVRAVHPDFVFMAEAYWDLERELQQLGFDFCYDKRLYDRLESADAPVDPRPPRAPISTTSTGWCASSRTTTSRAPPPRSRPSRSGRRPSSSPRCRAPRCGTRASSTAAGSGRPSSSTRRPARGAGPGAARPSTCAWWPTTSGAGALGARATSIGWPDNHSAEHLLAWTWTDGAPLARWSSSTGARRRRRVGSARLGRSRRPLVGVHRRAHRHPLRPRRRRADLRGPLRRAPGWGAHVFRVS